ncbi:DUF6968 family protein [Nocardia sp. NPDC051900]|uniref:DUF6968 family protein n=1 Tax=Nocardia sp. NPDC051900 TaxID=3364326 RepID=UPI0037B04054
MPEEDRAGEDVVAERIIETDSGSVRLVFFKPTTSGTSWHCRFRIEGVPDRKDIESSSSGRDSLEAFMLAMVAASMFFYDSPALSGISFHGSRDIGLLRTTKTPNGDLQSVFTLPAPQY